MKSTRRPVTTVQVHYGTRDNSVHNPEWHVIKPGMETEMQRNETKQKVQVRDSSLVHYPTRDMLSQGVTIFNITYINNLNTEKYQPSDDLNPRQHAI